MTRAWRPFGGLGMTFDLRFEKEVLTFNLRFEKVPVLSQIKPGPSAEMVLHDVEALLRFEQDEQWKKRKETIE